MSNKTKSNIPNQVKVGGFSYDVGQPDVVIIDGEARYAGSCDYTNKRIEVLHHLREDVKLHTYIHELLHAVFNEAGYMEHAEEMIVRVSNVLHQVIVDNNWKVGA